MSISPANSAGSNTPVNRRFAVTPIRTPLRSSGRKKAQASKGLVDPMSVCKAGATRRSDSAGAAAAGALADAEGEGEGGKENADDGFRFSSPGGGGDGGGKGGSFSVDNAFDLMPPPMPRTPGGGKGQQQEKQQQQQQQGLHSPSRPRLSTPVSPLGQHDPNRRQEEHADHFGGGGVGSGEQGGVGANPSASTRPRTFSLGSSTTTTTSRVDCKSPRGGTSQHSFFGKSSRGATAAAARCAPTPPRRSRSSSASGIRTQHLNGTGNGSVSGGCRGGGGGDGGGGGSGVGGDSGVGVGVGGGGGGGLNALLVGRAREFAEQGTAEALVGRPREAVRSFTRALKIVPSGWGGGGGGVEILLARAQVLSGLGKHEACAEDCRSALRVEPTLLRGITLLGHACLRMGLHAEASQFLHDGLALAMASGDASVMAEAQSACRQGIEEASLVGSALESGGRAASHGLHEVALLSAARVLEISPQCTAAQEMRVRGMGR
ncbi:unnamed protein product, partial [Laminaria digitata]